LYCVKYFFVLWVNLPLCPVCLSRLCIVHHYSCCPYSTLWTILWNLLFHALVNCLKNASECTILNVSEKKITLPHFIM
jgi:hypothetical protein